MKTVYLIDLVTGVLVGETRAQESPLEPGVYLIPSGAKELAPLTIPTGSRAVWMHDSNDWRVEAIPVEPAAPAQTAEELAPQQWASCQKQATAAYAASTDVVMRCYESEVPVPAEWVKYRKALRAITNATSGDPAQPFPARPVDPVGT